MRKLFIQNLKRKKYKKLFDVVQKMCKIIEKIRTLKMLMKKIGNTHKKMLAHIKLLSVSFT